MFSCGKKQSDQLEGADSTAVESIEVVEASVSFVSPSDGDTVSTALHISMGVVGMEVEPAGMVNEGKGHHHLIIDGSFVENGTVVPADSTHIHYGKGQTETDINLAPGTHTLTLQFANGVHASYGEAMSKTITVVVASNEN